MAAREMAHCDPLLNLPMKTPPNSPSLSPVATLDDGHAEKILLVDGDASARDAKRGEETLDKMDDGEPQLVSTSSETSPRSWTTKKEDSLLPPLSHNDPTTKIPSLFYSGKSLNILYKLWGARLCAEMEDKDVQDAFKKVHAQMRDEHHELLCYGAWYFQASKMRLLSPPWQEFFRFAFKEEPGIEERRIFAQVASTWSSRSNGKKTTEEISTMWKHMFLAIGESLKHQLQGIDYHLCSCHNSQPHSVTALQKNVQVLHDLEAKKAEERVKRAVFACTALIVLDFIIEEGGEISKHTCKDSYKVVCSAIQGFEGARGLSDETKYDLSNINAYLNNRGVS